MDYPICEACGVRLGPGDEYTATGPAGGIPRRAWHRACFDANPLSIGDIHRLEITDGRYYSEGDEKWSAPNL
jgi:hypothetical protein